MKTFKKAFNYSLINNSNFYSVYFDSGASVELDFVFNTFSSEKSIRFIRLYNLAFLFSNQRPFLKKIKFLFARKKILKRFFLSVRLNSRNRSNFLSYLNLFYTYFYSIFYQNSLAKCNYSNSNISLYLDNVQFFVKNYVKSDQKTQLKISLKSNTSINHLLVKETKNYFVLK